jgi:hypothetical protein
MAAAVSSLVSGGGVGATLRFRGIVRRAEGDAAADGRERDPLALDYQTYDPMA